MIDLTWYDFFEIGVDFIDEDHKHLLDIMQNVQNAANEADYPACAKKLNLLLIEAGNHFAREETFLAKSGYPKLDIHKDYHKQLLIKADMTRKICEGINSPHDIQECVDGMAKFLIDDILRGDIQFKSFLQHEGIIKQE